MAHTPGLTPMLLDSRYLDMRTSIIATAVATAGCGGSAAPTPPAPPAPTIAFDRVALDAWFDRDIAPRLPAGVVGVVVGDELVWHRAAGSRDGKGGPPPDRTSMFRIGSITKVLTGVAILQLRDRGVLDLDAPVARWVPELAARLVPKDGRDVTLRHLVTHTGGIPSVGDMSAPYWEQTAPSEAAMLKALDVPLAFPPGAKSEYSNAGMALAGVVIARATRRTYRDYMAREVLGPIGMAPAWDSAAIDPQVRVAGKGPDGAVDPPTWQLGAFEAAGGLWANLDQMVALARFALGRSGADRVLAPASRRAMTTDDPLPGPHGVAWVVGPGGAGHAGSTTDYSASLIVAPDDGAAGVVLAAGPDVELVDCAAIAAIRAVVKGTHPDPCAKPAPGVLDAAAQRAAFDRLLDFLAHPDEARAAATFAPEFLAAIPAARLIEMTGQITAQTGACTAHVIDTPGVTAGTAALTCARGRLKLQYVLDTGTPSRFIGLQALGVE